MICKHCGKEITGGDRFPNAQWYHVGGWYQCKVGKGIFAEPIEQHVFEAYGTGPFCFWDFCGMPHDHPVHVKEN